MIDLLSRRPNLLYVRDSGEILCRLCGHGDDRLAAVAEALCKPGFETAVTDIVGDGIGGEISLNVGIGLTTPPK